MKRHLKFWCMSIIHNCIAHPCLVVAEMLDCFGQRRLAELIFEFHDITIPVDDNRNKERKL